MPYLIKVAACLIFFLSSYLSSTHAAASELADYGTLPEFSLVERSGEKVGLKDLLGRVWIADFIFTRCGGPCPLITKHMYELQDDLPENVGFLSLTVDPNYDTPEVLSKYAKSYGAKPGRWLFLTGSRDDVYGLIRNGFHIGVDKNAQAEGVDDAFIHSLRFVLVDDKGRVRSYYTGDDREDLKRIGADLKALKMEKNGRLILNLPSLNAGLNALCAMLLITGYQYIRRKNIKAHKTCMVLAFLVSMAFLVSYLTYHYKVGSVAFEGQGWIRPVYFTILISHTILAVLIVPLALLTIYRGWKENFQKHVAIARWTLPIWLYVSVTGVTVYWMLYQMKPPLP